MFVITVCAIIPFKILQIKLQTYNKFYTISEGFGCACSAFVISLFLNGLKIVLKLRFLTGWLEWTFLLLNWFFPSSSDQKYISSRGNEQHGCIELFK